MDALPFSPIALVAVDPARNIHRRWCIRVWREAAGSVAVETHWGRLSTRGQRRLHRFASEDDAQRYIRAAVARRASAPRRIGVAYLPDLRLTTAAEGADADAQYSFGF